LLRETSDGKDFLQARQKNSGGAKGAFTYLDALKVSKVALIPVKAGISMETIENSMYFALKRRFWDTNTALPAGRCVAGGRYAEKSLEAFESQVEYSGREQRGEDDA
jgi:hypothetical protein